MSEVFEEIMENLVTEETAGPAGPSEAAETAAEAAAEAEEAVETAADAAAEVEETAEEAAEETAAVLEEVAENVTFIENIGLDDEEEAAPEEEKEDAAGPAELKRGPLTVIGVRFRTAGKIYYFDPDGQPVRKNDHVIVETARGLEYGTVVSDPMQISRSKFNKTLKKIIRKATEQDDARQTANRAKEKDAFAICLEKIKKHNPEMKLIDVEYTFDNSKILFYFTADGRVDFRNLVKELAMVFKTRIELRQIGVRDEAKILGGYGICGRPLCCHTYLSDFAPVSIKMAKEQNLSLNPAKISGLCGRLMCCLKNEEEIYEELNRKLPKPGDEVRGSDGLTGEVDSVNILRQTVRILVEVDDEKELHEYGDGEWTLIRKRRKGKPGGAKKPKQEAEEEKGAEALEMMENRERKPRGNKNHGKAD